MNWHCLSTVGFSKIMRGVVDYMHAKVREERGCMA